MVYVNGGMVPPIGPTQGRSQGQSPVPHGVDSNAPAPGGGKIGDLPRNHKINFTGKKIDEKNDWSDSPVCSVVKDPPGGDKKAVCKATIYVHLALNAANCDKDQVAKCKELMEDGAEKLGGHIPCGDDEDGPGITIDVVIVWHPAPKKGVGEVVVDCNGGLLSEGEADPKTGRIKFGGNLSWTSGDPESAAALCGHEIGHIMWGRPEGWGKDLHNNDKTDPPPFMRNGLMNKSDRSTQEELTRLAGQKGLDMNIGGCCWAKKKAAYFDPRKPPGRDESVVLGVVQGPKGTIEQYQDGAFGRTR